MKKSIILSTILGLMLFGCNNQAAENHDESHNAEQHEDHDHAASEESEALELNNGEKWKVNEEMTPFIVKAESELKAYISSKGTDYKKLAEKQAEVGTEVILKIKENTEDETYDEYLEDYRLRAIIKKYSDFIRYPIKMDVTESISKEGNEGEFEDVIKEQIINSMVPIWKKNKNELTDA